MLDSAVRSSKMPIFRPKLLDTFAQGYTGDDLKQVGTGLEREWGKGKGRRKSVDGKGGAGKRGEGKGREGQGKEVGGERKGGPRGKRREG